MIEKPKKNKKQTVAYWSKKADRKLQEICRIMYEDDGCLLFFFGFSIILIVFEPAFPSLKA